MSTTDVDLIVDLTSAFARGIQEATNVLTHWNTLGFFTKQIIVSKAGTNEERIYALITRRTTGS